MHTNRKTDLHKHMVKLLRDARRRARAKHLGEVTLTPAHLVQMYYTQKGLCALSAVPMAYGRASRGHQHAISLDRVKCSDGYHSGNIQLLTRCCNNAKGTLPTDKFLCMCRSVYGATKEQRLMTVRTTPHVEISDRSGEHLSRGARGCHGYKIA